MKSTFIQIIILVLFSTFFLSCTNNDLDKALPNETVEDLVVEPEFKFNTSEDINLKFNAVRNGGSPLAGMKFTVWNGEETKGGEIVFQGISDENGIFEAKLNLPTYKNKIIVKTVFEEKQIEINSNLIEQIFVAPF
ncbi:MAG: hypothetical protein DWQ06_13530 [Calditrichaeota bacterium]|nr:MAG: hypothetical protein DWQ06_13530 [Calditrichota bacterium]